MDLLKAFDCVPYGLLIAKFKAYGLTNEACEFMSCYLSGRCQRVGSSNEKDSWETLTKDIPQGSGLGPIIFNIFMNDAFYFIQKCDFVNYADDDTLSKISSTMESLMKCLMHYSEVAINWFHNNFMEVNPSKLQFMLLKYFTSKADLPNHMLINNTRIERESQVKLLGVIIDDKLKFNKHINVLCENAYRFKNVFNIEEKEDIHNTFILANCNYCPIVWQASINKMEKTQERAL